MYQYQNLFLPEYQVPIPFFFSLSTRYQPYFPSRVPGTNPNFFPEYQVPEYQHPDPFTSALRPRSWMNITPRRRGKSPRPHSQPHSPVPSLLLEPSSRPTSSGGVPWEPGFKTQLVTSLRSPGRGHAQDMAGPREDGGCMRFWEARSRTGRRGS